MSKQAAKKRSPGKTSRPSKKTNAPAMHHAYVDVTVGMLVFAVLVGIGFWVDALATKTHSLQAVFKAASHAAAVNASTTSTYGYNATGTPSNNPSVVSYGYNTTNTSGNPTSPTPTYGYNTTSTSGSSPVSTYGYNATSTSGYGYRPGTQSPPQVAAIGVIDLRATHTVVDHGKRTRVYGILRGTDGRRLSNMPLSWSVSGGKIVRQGARGSYQFIDVQADYFEHNGSLKVSASYFGNQESVSIKIREPQTVPRLRFLPSR